MTHDPTTLRRYVADARKALDQLDSLLSPVTTGETLDAWSRRWAKSRSGRIRGAERELGRYQQWIAPRLGTRPVAAITRAEVEDWIEHMESAVTAGQLRGTTAWRIWTVLRTMMRDASAGRVKALRLRNDNPTTGLRFDRGTARVGTFLYPSEFLRLMNCERIPLELRRQYALALYLYPRAGELAALEWPDIDIATGRIHIHRSLGRDGETRATKTGEDRQFIAERALMPLLRSMHRAARGRGHIIGLGERTSKGATLRRDLRHAGCRRADLYASDATRRPFTFHDLRATGITWQAMRGDSPTAIMERVGHQHLATTERYMRRGRLMALARGERVFPAPPKCLFGPRT